MLDESFKTQCTTYLNMMEGKVELLLDLDTQPLSLELKAFAEELAELSPHLQVRSAALGRQPALGLARPGEAAQIQFVGLPMGHEFSTFLLALLQLSGRPVKEAEALLQLAKSLSSPCHFVSYISLSCQICPNVMQAINSLCVLNPLVSHTIIDGAVCPEEAESRQVMAVPTVFCNDQPFSTGDITLSAILEKLSGQQVRLETAPFDVLVLGAGPAGSAAAIYAARKGIRVGLLSETMGGQLRDTQQIENLISVPLIEAPELISRLEQHVREYPVELLSGHRVSRIESGDELAVHLESGERLLTKALVLAVGAKWRKTGLPGEERLLKKGVAFCPHCDGPLYRGRPVCVVGGGNSGVEAAIDLANTSSEVTLFEFLPELKADAVLQAKLRSLPNVTIHTNAQLTEILGEDKVSAVTWKDRSSGELHQTDCAAVFVQIGLLPNTDFLKGSVDLNERGEIITDARGATNVPGVYAAGDCTDSAYKQIIISMGSGATAALGAFDYLMRSFG